MAPLSSKPESVLKQAEALVAVGQQNAALQTLTEVFSSKRFRSVPIASLEPIMLRLLELAVDMRRGRTAKEALMQYKNLAQNTSVPSIETVVKKFLAHADAKVLEAQAQAEKAVLDVDDLEASETPEDVLLGAVSGDQSKDRTDRALVTPWLKFSWESYRTALETVKNNARLEIVYQQVAILAFKFCLKYTRKVEFRRLCETLRLHLANVAKYANQPGQQFTINLSDPDTLQRYLDVRFAQLNASVELELWQEAFRSVEDIHNLLTLAKKAPRPAMMANYYEQLTKIFLTSGNALYHAAAWSKYFSVVRAIGGKSEDELAQLAGLVLISALAIPVADGEEEESRSKSARLAALVGFSKPPKRSSLLREALLRNALAVSRPEVQSLYQILEVDLHPLTICTTISPIFRSLAADPLYAPYLPHLHRVLLSRLLSQLGQVYASVRLSFLSELIAPLNEPWDLKDKEGNAILQETWDVSKLEAFVVSCARRGELSIRVDHADGSIAFVDDVFGASATSTPGASTSTAGSSLAQLQASPAELIRTRFARLATTLATSITQLFPPESAPPQTEEHFASLVKAADAERSRLSVRRAMITRRAELLAELSIRKKQEDESRKAEEKRRQAVEDEKLAREKARRREQERIQKEIENAQKEEAKTLAKNLAKSGLKINDEDIEKYDADELVRIRVKQIEKEKKELGERLRILHKRVDHLERAYRKEEAPLLAQDYARQQEEDRITHEQTVTTTRSAAKQKHREDLHTKTRLRRMLDDYHGRRQQLAGKREEDYRAKLAEAKALIEKEKAARLEQFTQERAARKAAYEAEEKAHREQEEEARKLEEERLAKEERLHREQEEAEAAAEAKKKAEAEKIAAARAAREEERKKDAETLRLRAQREEEALRKREEEKRAAAAAATSSPARPSPVAATNGATAPPLIATPAAAGGGWRARQAAKENESISSAASPLPVSTPVGRVPSSTGAYRPPGSRGLASSPSGTPPPSSRPLDSKPSIFGGGRTREEALGSRSASGKQPESPSPVPPANANAKDADGFQAAAPKWKPRVRGAGDASPR